MGLSIHYTLESDSPDRDHARQLVEQLHRATRDLPFAEVEDLVEFVGEHADADNLEPDDPNRWLLIQANHLLVREGRVTILSPSHVIAFSVFPGQGCESANFGLCQYPGTFEWDEETAPTGLAPWHWHSFCKTQYSSNPKEGGIENFLRCHQTIIQLLDRARELNLLAEVKDESGFWEHRNLPKLAETITEWNRQIAGFVGRFKDRFGGDFEAPITEFPNFEHLEADERQE